MTFMSAGVPQFYYVVYGVLVRRYFLACASTCIVFKISWVIMSTIQSLDVTF